MSRCRSAILVLVVAVALAACGAGGGGSDGGALRFTLAANVEEVRGYETLVAEFTEESGLDVQMTPVADRDSLLAKLTTDIAGGNPPDVFLLNWRSYGQFAATGSLEPVGPYLERSDTLDADDFVAPPFEAFRHDGRLACMPQNASSLVVYYNADLFDDAGLAPPGGAWTWDDLVDVAGALTGGDVYGIGIEPELIKVAPFVWQAGGELVDDPQDPTALALEDGPARGALDWFLDLSLEHGVVPPDREEQAEDSLSRFLNGRLAMFVSSRVEVPTLRTIEDFAWDVAPLPRPPGGQATTILHSDAYCIAADSPRKDDAWRFVEFAESRRGQEILAASGRTVPSRRDVASSPVFLEPDEPPASAHVFVDNVERMRISPTIASWPLVERVGDAILEDVFYGRVDRDAGIARLHRETDPLFEQVPDVGGP